MTTRKEGGAGQPPAQSSLINRVRRAFAEFRSNQAERDFEANWACAGSHRRAALARKPEETGSVNRQSPPADLTRKLA